MNSVDRIKGLIQQQATALNSLSETLGESVQVTIDMILKLKGRVIVTGMGKSGHIGNKVAATLSSTGTPAFFVHPSESLHGDLGMITQGDLVIFISKSGENPELNLMVPTLKRMGVPMVALTCNVTSSLALLSDVIIDLGDVQEICPLDLAPTTSSTLSLVILDSIAMELMRLRDFQVDQYAMFHPGGRLGRRLLFGVKDLMISGKALPTVEQTSDVKQVLHEMTRGMMGAVLVLDDDRKLLGLITDNDVRRVLEHHQNFFELKALDVMNSKPSSCRETDNAYEVLLNMRKRSKPITLMPVLNEQDQACGVLRLETMVQQGLV